MEATALLNSRPSRSTQASPKANGAQPATGLEGTALEDTALEDVRLEHTVTDLAPRLLRFALGRYGGGAGSAALAEEASQDALAALVGRWRRHGPPDSPEAFAFAVLRRRLARARVRRALSRPLEILTGAEERDDGAGPERLADARAELREVRGAVSRLPSKLREALLLVTVGGLETKAAADVLSISLSALKMRVLRARDQLRNDLENQPEREP